MAKLKGLAELAEAIEALKVVAEEVRGNLEEKQAWCDERSDKWQESDKRQEWDDFLGEVESVLDDIENMSELPEEE